MGCSQHCHFTLAHVPLPLRALYGPLPPPRTLTHECSLANYATNTGTSEYQCQLLAVHDSLTSSIFFRLRHPSPYYRYDSPCPSGVILCEKGHTSTQRQAVTCRPRSLRVFLKSLNHQSRNHQRVTVHQSPSSGARPVVMKYATIHQPHASARGLTVPVNIMACAALCANLAAKDMDHG